MGALEVVVGHFVEERVDEMLLGLLELVSVVLHGRGERDAVSLACRVTGAVHVARIRSPRRRRPMDDFRTVPLERLAAMVRSGDVSSRELVTHALEMVDKTEQLNAWVAVDAERALDAAATIDDDVAHDRPLGPLAGIPIGVKDLEHAKGFRTGYGSLLNADDAPATDDSLLVAR